MKFRRDLMWKAAGCLFIGLALLFNSCKKDEQIRSNPFLIFLSGSGFTPDGAVVPLGGVLKFGISAVGGGGIITDFRVRKISGGVSMTMLDKGMWREQGGFDTTLIFNKGTEPEERWEFFIMTHTRDTAVISITVLKGSGNAFGAIHYYPSITIGYPANSSYPHFVDLSSGVAYSGSTVSGFENKIDLASFFYFTGGKPSPTLTCPSYTTVVGYYPEITGWPVRNSTSYDYNAVDNNRISVAQFMAAENDSLLINAFNATQVSGLCKYCYTGKVVPFKTSRAKLGLIYVIRADESETGSMEIAVKIQE